MRPLSLHTTGTAQSATCIPMRSSTERCGVIHSRTCHAVVSTLLLIQMLTVLNAQPPYTTVHLVALVSVNCRPGSAPPMRVAIEGKRIIPVHYYDSRGLAMNEYQLETSISDIDSRWIHQVYSLGQQIAAKCEIHEMLAIFSHFEWRICHLRYRLDAPYVGAHHLNCHMDCSSTNFMPTSR